MVIPIDGYPEGFISSNRRAGNPEGLPSRNSTRKNPSTDRKRKHESDGISANSASLVPVTLDIDREPWERQKAERLNYYRWFQVYLDLDTSKSERTARAAWRASCSQAGVRISPRIFNHCIKVWRWKERAEAWDDYTFNVKRSAYVKTLELMSARQARRGVILAGVGAAIIRRFSAAFSEKGAALSLRDLNKLFRPAMEAIQVGQREERMARGFTGGIALPVPQDEDLFERVLTNLEIESSPEVEQALDQLEEVLSVTVTRTTRKTTKASKPELDAIEAQYTTVEETD